MRPPWRTSRTSAAWFATPPTAKACAFYLTAKTGQLPSPAACCKKQALALRYAAMAEEASEKEAPIAALVIKADKL
jgi:hypothetical protein